MGSAALLVTLGGALLLVGALVAAALLTRSASRRQEALGAELRRSRAQVELMNRRLEELARQVGEARSAPARDPQYVITALRPRPDEARGRAAAGDLEDRLVGLLTRRTGPAPQAASAGPLVDTVVRAVAVGHGIRRAVSADNLDRAAAEAQLARRRSRRRRRQEQRDVRRLLRATGSPR